MTDPVRAELTPIVRAAVLEAFKLGVGHAIGVIEERVELTSQGRDIALDVLVLTAVARQLRAYAATVTYEELP